MQDNLKTMYTCPMHPEVRQDSPGECPKCGMNLVLERKVVSVTIGDDRGLGKLTWHNYLPLLVIFSLLLVTSVVLLFRDYFYGSFSLESGILYFMTGFFLVFAGFKLVDLKGFAEGYATYDILAKKVFVWGYIYPFVELVFGLLMLVGYHPLWLLWTEFFVMAFSGVGVMLKFVKGESVMCVCLGTFLKIPLTKITLIEDFGMALLALSLILY